MNALRAAASFALILALIVPLFLLMVLVFSLSQIVVDGLYWVLLWLSRLSLRLYDHDPILDVREYRPGQRVFPIESNDDAP
jgi:hypothetical protein